ncbi:methyltransferase domain-containing protein [Bradyrhizobium sp. LHD-71]|uniref:protein-L-isoaspartate O-methyltransferase family protein n=1 Tax=Bradyrhizobium sp. LHD-71 TaxID=3072141 RepID=UPI00280E0D16|nr:methyltransferase domain-containing protein [Bradyrhizobium sp. LHD-71]MDQ8731761.1 methyltransferase domain-containing protein [Bradyrhizobium sp. LHD-71]
MDRQGELSIIRAAYAKQILAAARVDDDRLGAAFSAIRREDFLGPGPWPVLRWFRDYALTPDTDPVYLYTDDVVGILPERHINNGQPSLHAHLMHRASPATGERVVHVGTGTGYYTAILAHLAGPSGRVTGIEHDPELAVRAKVNLAPWPHVEIIEGDGAQVSFGEADVIYVNAGCTRPAQSWLDRLADGGRLILPMTSDQGFGARRSPEQIASAGAVFRIERRGHDYFARWISGVAIFPCAGSRDEVSERALAEAFAKQGWQQVTRLYRDQQIPEDRCWLRGSGWCLAYS